MSEVVATEATNSTEETNTESSSVLSEKCQKIHFLFTWNNYNEENISSLLRWLSNEATKYCFQEEVGEQGTSHLQGYFALKRKKLVKDIFKAHQGWHCKVLKYFRNDPTYQWAVNYCLKDKTRKVEGRTWCQGVVREETLKTHLQNHPWQMELISELDTEPNPRKILWYVDQKGGLGKSCLTKYLCATRGALVLCGKASDMKFGIVNFKKCSGVSPRIIIIDLPRTFDNSHLSYSGIEEIKNGCFFSNKYEGGMCLFNNPHVVVFSNQKPDLKNLTTDRWDIRTLSNLPQNSPPYGGYHHLR